MNMCLHINTIYIYIINICLPFNNEVKHTGLQQNPVQSFKHTGLQQNQQSLSQDSLPRCSLKDLVVGWTLQKSSLAANKSQEAQRVFKWDPPRSSAQYWGANSSTPCHSPILNFTPPQLLAVKSKSFKPEVLILSEGQEWSRMTGAAKGTVD